MQTKKSVQSVQAVESPAELADLVEQSIPGDLDPRSNKEVQRDEAIKAHYVQVMDAYGEVWPEYIADGICEHCHTAEGVRKRSREFIISGPLFGSGSSPASYSACNAG